MYVAPVSQEDHSIFFIPVVKHMTPFPETRLEPNTVNTIQAISIQYPFWGGRGFVTLWELLIGLFLQSLRLLLSDSLWWGTSAQCDILMGALSPVPRPLILWKIWEICQQLQQIVAWHHRAFSQKRKDLHHHKLLRNEYWLAHSFCVRACVISVIDQDGFRHRWLVCPHFLLQY